jgi:hypothetical protein
VGKHRGLTLDKLIKLVQWDDVQRYLARLAPEAEGDDWAFINADALRAFLDTPENSDAAGIIMEHFYRINDICWRDGALLVQVARQYHVEYDQDLPDLTFALRLYLDHPDAFEFAWSMYLRIALNAGPCEYRFPAGVLSPTPVEVALLESNLRGWFSNMKKGGQCLVACFPEGDGLLIRITRGARIKTIARWRGFLTEIDSFRPASEDVVWYDPDESRLSVKASLRRDREQYVRAIADIFAGRPELAELAIKEAVFSLTPFQTGEFDYRGDGILSNLRLIEVDLALRGLTTPSLTLRSGNILTTLQDEMPGITLQSGDLTRVKLRADIQTEVERRPREVVFEIAPPGFSNVGEKAYRGALEQYLRRQRVKLN